MTGLAHQFGIVGAGRLAERVAGRWWSASGAQALVWSRRFVGDRGIPRDPAERPFGVGDLADVMQRPVVLLAVPGSAIGELAAAHRALAEFQGVMLVAAVDIRLEEVQSLCPRALIVRVAQFLLPGQNEIPCLVFVPHQNDARWSACASLLEKLGPVDLVRNQAAFDTLLNFGSPFPAVLEKALHRGVCLVSSLRGVSPELNALAERLLWQGLVAIGSARLRGAAGNIEREVATEGGITERGLREVGSLADATADVILKMSWHAEDLRSQVRRDVRAEVDDESGI